jgi:hypothetical protein
VYDEPLPQQVAEVAPVEAPIAQYRDDGPFTSGRQPVSSGEPAAVGGAPAPSMAAIERDPNVNKSLLLRLIAGVRGL